jgi:hypothetical protein
MFCISASLDDCALYHTLQCASVTAMDLVPRAIEFAQRKESLRPNMRGRVRCACCDRVAAPAAASNSACVRCLAACLPLSLPAVAAAQLDDNLCIRQRVPLPDPGHVACCTCGGRRWMVGDIVGTAGPCLEGHSFDLLWDCATWGALSDEERVREA